MKFNTGKIQRENIANNNQVKKGNISKGNSEVLKKEKSVIKPGLYGKPSDKLNKILTQDVFASKPKTANSKSFGFQHYYHNGMIPCKINHGSISNKLTWEQSIDITSKFNRC